MKSVFIPPEILSTPDSMDNPVMKHHRISLNKNDKWDRKHLSGVYPEMRQHAPSQTSSSSIFFPRLAKTRTVAKGLKDTPEAILAVEKSKTLRD